MNFCELQLLYKLILNKEKLFYNDKTYETIPYFYDLKNNIIKFLFCEMNNNITLLEVNKVNILKNNEISCSSAASQFINLLLEMQEKMRSILLKDKSNVIFNNFDSMYKYFKKNIPRSKIVKLTDKKQECFICYDEKDEIFITECAHMFCLDCLKMV